MDFGKWGTKTFTQGEQMKKTSINNFFHRGDFALFISKSFQIWDHFFLLLFPKDSENLKSLDIGLWEVGARRPLNRVRNTDTKKILLSKAKFAEKLTLFCAAIFHPLLKKVFKSETTSLFYFSPRIANLQKVWTSDLSKLFINLFLVYL